MRIVLFEPQIPQNTGNIARTCAASNTQLVLVRPLGFSLSSRHLKRAGLDYWEHVDLQVIETLEEALIEPFYFFSTRAKQPYTDITFTQQATLVFGSETAGLPQEVHDRYREHFYTIPMPGKVRSLNLASSAAIVLYEGLRQISYSRTLEKVIFSSDPAIE